MWINYIARFFRRKLVLAIIFCLSLTYCIMSFLTETQSIPNEDTFLVRRKLEYLLRNSENRDKNDTEPKPNICKNSVQGKFLIADERGYVCKRSELLSNGCCDANMVDVKRYYCDNCNDNGCCSVYENCISCCLHPDNKPVLENVVGRAHAGLRILLSAVSNHFELCLAKCRTSSVSVYHENSYRNPQSKYCYGEVPLSSDPVMTVA